MENYKHNQETLKAMLPLLKRKFKVKSVEMDTVFIRLNGKDDIEITSSSLKHDQFTIHLWLNESVTKDNVRVNKDRLIPMLHDLVKLYEVGYHGRSYKEIEEYKVWYK
jgi:hypothetical protein